MKTNRFPGSGWIGFSLLAFATLPLHAIPISSIRIETSQGMTSTVPVKMAFDAEGRLFAVGQGFDGGLVAGLYAADGSEVWRRHFLGVDPPYFPMAITIDGQGGLLVTATAMGASKDYLTLKYAADGEILWTNRLDGAGGGDDRARAITSDSSGNVYVTGDTWVSSTNIPLKGTVITRAITTVSYSSSGELRWRNDYQPHASGRTADAIAVDTQGRVFVSGMSTVFTDPRSPQDAWVIIALASSNGVGQVIYNRGNQNGGVGMSGESRLMFGPDGGLIFAGRKRTSLPMFITVVHFGPDLLQRWTTDTHFAGWSMEGGLTALDGDAAGEIYVGHHYHFPAPSPYPQDQGNFRLSRFAPTGELRGEAQFDGVASMDDVMTAMLVDDTGQVYTTGTSALPGGALEWSTVKFDVGGNRAWVERFGSETDPGFQPLALRLAGRSELCVAGTAPGTDQPGIDLLLLKYPTTRALVRALSDTSLLVEFNAQPGATNRIQISVDLVEWTDLATAVADESGRVRHQVERNPAAAQQFFRSQPQ